MVHITTNDIFTTVESEASTTKLEMKIETLNLYTREQITPKIMEQSPYKLHISLSRTDYYQYKNQLKEILIHHIDLGSIDNFKFVEDEIILESMEKTKEFLSLLYQYKEFSEKNEKPDEEWAKNYWKKADSFFGTRQRSFLNAWRLELTINSIQGSLASLERLYKSDQFTIYIPENFTDTSIINLCNDINCFLEIQNCRPSDILYDVESPVGNYINLRQEYLIKDHEEINTNGFIDFSKRIDTVPSNENDKQDEKRTLVKIEQENSSLYKFLVGNLKKIKSTSNLAQHSLFRSEQPQENPSQVELNDLTNEDNASKERNSTKTPHQI